MISALLLSLVSFTLQPIEAGEATKIAGEWWGEYHRGDSKFGAAWYNEDAKNYYVGVCDGFASTPGFKRIVVEGKEGYYNFSTESKFKTPDGKWYSNAVWFGCGKTYEEAFYDAIKKGHCPLKRAGTLGHTPDFWMKDKFIKERGLKPFKYEEDK